MTNTTTTPQPTVPDTRNRDRWLLISFTVLALLVRLFRLDYRSMWTDEFHTLKALLLPWNELVWERLRSGHMPTYFLFMKAWTALFGTSDIALRLPSALAGALLVPAIVYFARPWFAPRITWSLVLIGTFNGLAVWASQEARMYSMLLVAATIAHGAWMRALYRHERGAWAVYVLAALLALSLHPLMALWLATHGIVAWHSARQQAADFRRQALPWILTALVVIPLVIAVALLQEKRSLGFDSHDLADFAKDFSRNVGILLKRTAAIAFGISVGAQKRWQTFGGLVLLASLWLFAKAWKRQVAGAAGARRPDLQALQACLWLVLLPSTALFVAEFFTEHVLGNERYLVPASVPLWTVLVWAWTEGNHRRLRGALLGSSVFLFALGSVLHARDRGLGGREAVYYINARALASDAVVCSATPTVALMVQHYSFRPLPLCLVREPDIDEPSSMHELSRQLDDCLAGRRRFWVFEYRQKGSTLRQFISSHPERFRVLKEKRIGSARAVLIEHRTSRP